MSKQFDPKKPAQTRGGLKARIISTNRKSVGDKYPIIALVPDSNDAGCEVADVYAINGAWQVERENRSRDLINVPEEKVSYLNIYPHTAHVTGGFHTTLESATNVAVGEKRIGTIKIVESDDELVSVEIVDEDGSDR